MGPAQCYQSNEIPFLPMIRNKLIQQTVSTLLEEAGISEPGLDVKRIAENRGAIVVEEPNENDFSGFLFRSSDSSPIIGVNANHAPTRKRFTIAHELGHLLLHSKSGVHVDQAIVQMRDATASAGVDEDEMEANRFAAELLMPRSFLERDLEALGPIHADDERAIASLAKKYRVSPQAMAIRLSALKLVWM
jgi:Zn-dependent peptidase ImmA (M78 family)